MVTFLERYLKKARAEDITYSDVDAFLQQGIEENQNLEYKPRGMLVRQDDSIIKSPNRWDVVGFSALAKVVAGFANAEGGLLVLGVEELVEWHDKVPIKKRPGPISPLPVSVTREQIENQLLAKIKQPIAGITIVPVYPETTHVIYLIDIPQSIRIPHRVDELFYYQRVNFSTLELQHFQIADLFGKRLAPDLDIELKWGGGTDDHFILHPIIRNRGRAVAKYVLCTFTMEPGPYTITEAARGWGNHNGTWEYHAGVNMVVYPDRPLDTDLLYFRLSYPGSEVRPLTFHFGLYAEDMVGKEVTVTLDPRDHSR